MRTKTHLLAAVAAGGLLAWSSAPARSQQISFSDETQAAGLAFSHAWGVAGPIPLMNFNGMEVLMTGAGATADFDKDGWPDLVLIGGGGSVDRIFWNRGDGTFQLHTHWVAKVVGDPGPAAVHQGGGIAVGDFDKDGWLDIFLGSFGPTGAHQMGQHKLYRNMGNGSFLNVAAQAGVTTTSPLYPDAMGAAFGDYDLDGDLDLFVAGWRVRPMWGLSNRLFRNEGNGTFTDVTFQAGVLKARFAGFQPAFADMNGDRYPEIVSTGDYKTSRYFKNNTNGTFTDITAQSGTGQDLSGMGSTVADFDGDGRLDWFVSAIYEIQNGWDGNKMYLNLGQHTYTEVASQWGVDDGYWGWGTYGADFDNDGLTDILETNGWWFPQWQNDPDCLWLQQPPGASFLEQAQQTGAAAIGQGRGLVVFDYDKDGDLDWVTTRNNQPVRLVRNDLQSSAHWLRVDLDTSGDPSLAPNGWGSRIIATAGSQQWVRYVGAVYSFLAQSELTAHFGLGNVTQIDTLRVEWPDGTAKVLTNVAVDQTLTIAP